MIGGLTRRVFSAPLRLRRCAKTNKPSLPRTHPRNLFHASNLCPIRPRLPSRNSSLSKNGESPQLLQPPVSSRRGPHCTLSSGTASTHPLIRSAIPPALAARGPESRMGSVGSPSTLSATPARNAVLYGAIRQERVISPASGVFEQRKRIGEPGLRPQLRDKPAGPIFS